MHSLARDYLARKAATLSIPMVHTEPQVLHSIRLHGSLANLAPEEFARLNAGLERNQNNDTTNLRLVFRHQTAWDPARNEDLVPLVEERIDRAKQQCQVRTPAHRSASEQPEQYRILG